MSKRGHHELQLTLQIVCVYKWEELDLQPRPLDLVFCNDDHLQTLAKVFQNGKNNTLDSVQ